ncbi:hypothetical protein Pla52o_25110 [Novipirellula galeiformis]|uniref:DUF7336 domain-containing protein n=1 Tax=Novipirellula galeiformis TaxID=2528004 RepID=A0A5C6C9U4_9BACT|nr:hypothetical protein [Novipirellula galeiformis]TWU20174.1 hypothetical protein Pla52o_46890 [Novipirellula galeiformis]TWU22977.1 hypothetical protein Pla52o_25110 [Novipirellula galeiformis]
MTKVFVLQHEHEICGREHAKFIGVYATNDDAEDAIVRLRMQPGFRDWPDGFSIGEYELGVDHWVEGFITAVNILIPSRTSAGEYYTAGSVWYPGDVYEITDIDAPQRAKFDVGDFVRCIEKAVPEIGDRVLVAYEAVEEKAEPRDARESPS